MKDENAHCKGCDPVHTQYCAEGLSSLLLREESVQGRGPLSSQDSLRLYFVVLWPLPPRFTGHRHLGKVLLLWGLDFPPKISRLLQMDKKGQLRSGSPGPVSPSLLAISLSCKLPEDRLCLFLITAG